MRRWTTALGILLFGWLWELAYKHYCKKYHWAVMRERVTGWDEWAS